MFRIVIPPQNHAYIPLFFTFRGVAEICDSVHPVLDVCCTRGEIEVSILSVDVWPPGDNSSVTICIFYNFYVICTYTYYIATH